MPGKPNDHSHAPAHDPAAASHGSHHDAGHHDHFLKLMLFQASRPGVTHAVEQPPEPLTGDFVPLQQYRSRSGVRYALPVPSGSAPVHLDSPALEVMTDLRQVGAVIIGLDASIAAANQAMIDKGVRALFVADDARKLLGIVTATDILGERPIRFAQERGVRRNDVVVRDIMTPAGELDVLDFREVARARVGDVVATLRLAGRQHVLAVEVVEGASTVCGIFSLTQIARQLGIAPLPTHDIPRTFAEIEAAIGG
jgi:CBS domain-containing protein